MGNMREEGQRLKEKRKTLQNPTNTPHFTYVNEENFSFLTAQVCHFFTLGAFRANYRNRPVHSHFYTVSLSASSAQTTCYNLGVAKAEGKYWFSHNNTKTVRPNIFWRLLQNIHFEGQVWLDRLLLKRAAFLVAAVELLFTIFYHRKRIVDARNFFYSGK